MKLKVVTLRFDDETGGFDDRELLDFVGDEDQPREVLEVSEHFFVHDRRPTWALLLSYRDIPRPGEKKTEARKDWRAELDDRGRLLFDEVRKWRAATCKRDGLPPLPDLHQQADRRDRRSAGQDQGRPPRDPRPRSDQDRPLG